MKHGTVYELLPLPYGYNSRTFIIIFVYMELDSRSLLNPVSVFLSPLTAQLYLRRISPLLKVSVSFT